MTDTTNIFISRNNQIQNGRLQLSTAVDNLLWRTCQITGMHWIQLIWIVRVSVLDSDDEYNDEYNDVSISPTGMKNGENVCRWS